MASHQLSPSSEAPSAAGASETGPRSGVASPLPPSSTRHHVTPQILTLGQRDDENDHYYRAAHEVDVEEGARNRAAAEPSAPSSSWYMRIIPMNPFASASAPGSTGEASRRGGGAAPPPRSKSSSDAAGDSSSYRSLGGGDNGENDRKKGVDEALSATSRTSSRGEAFGPARQQRRYIPAHRPRQPGTTSAPATAGGLSQPILSNSTTSPADRSLRAVESGKVSSVEEEIAKHSFFYREEGSQEDHPGPWQRHHKYRRPRRRRDGLELSSAAALSSTTSSSSSFRTLLYDPARTTELGYRDLASLHVSLAPPVLSRYRAKYELLNQPMATRRPSSSRRGLSSSTTSTRLYHFYNAGGGDDDGDNYDDDLSEGGDDYYLSADADATGGYDLELCEQTGPLSKVRRTDSATLSSLLYRSERGRVLLRLPSDQVRLVMDPDLQPGILSVEQWRKCEQEYNNESKRPSLHYVLTVQEDLYRKIVGELSDAVTNPYCGMSKCCSEKEFVDIRVAVAIVGFMLSVLLLLTFVWPVS